MESCAMLARFEQFSSSVSCIYKYIQKIEREEAAHFGLKGPHVQCLVALSQNGEGLTASQLCEACDKDKAAISRTVSELEGQGLLRRDGNSYRARLRLTGEGQRTACQIAAIVESAVERAGRGLREEDRRVFYAALDLIASNLRAISEEGLPENSPEQDRTEGDSL